MDSKLLLVLLFTFFPVLLFGQDPFYLNYDTKDGLPSSEVYAVEVDSNGMLWFATDRGVCSYNGYEFKTYTTDDGLANNTTLTIWKDRKGNFWFPGLDGSLSIYDHEKFFPYKWNDKLKEFTRGRFIQNVVWDEPGKMYFWMTGTGAVEKFSISDQNGQISKVEFDSLKRKHPVVEHEKLSFIDLNGYFIPDDTRVGLRIIEQDSHYVYIDIHKERNLLKEFDQFSMISKENDFAVDIKIDKILNLYVDNLKNIWICTKSGAYKYRSKNIHQDPVHYFIDVAITDICRDYEGNYWLTTLENGILFIPSFQFKTLKEQSHPLDPTKMMVEIPLKNHIIFGNSKGEISYLGRNKELKKVKIENENNQYFFGQNKDNKAYLRNTLAEEVNNRLVFNKILTHIDTYYTYKLENGKYFVILTVGFRVMDPDTRKYSHNYYKLFPEKIISVNENQNTLWIGTTNGLYSIHSTRFDSIINEHTKFPLLKHRINDIKSDTSNNLWLATVGAGLLFKTIDTVVQITIADGLNSKLVNRVFLENDSTLWVATNNGLNKIIYTVVKNSISVKKIVNYNTTDGLLTNFINDITKWDNQIWLATNKGINYFSPEDIRSKLPHPPIILNNITVNGDSLEIGALNHFKYDQNDVYFKFTGISYRKSLDRPFYRYRLKSENTDSTWYYTNNRDVRFNDLKAGDYTFEAAAQNKYGQWSEKPIRYSFTIQPHFTQTLWFRLVIGALIFAIIFAFVRTRSLRIKFKEEQKRKLQDAELKTKDAELQALRNQMNPHFVFNALNSIQNFVFKNDAKKANYYLSRFSKLMRDGLQFARLKYISLKEEVIFLNTYLELEKMRFPDKFQYNVIVDEDIPTHQYFIPPLLFQPILENAVKHAFKNIDYEGLLEIHFEEITPGEMLKITITDNGEGFNLESVNKTTQSENKSLGLEIINNQIALLNSEGKDRKASFKIFNRNVLNNTLTGTQAEFIISIKYSEND